MSSTRAISTDQAVRDALEQHAPRVWRFALALSGQKDIADDLSQATALRAMEKHGQVTSAARLDAWLMTICRSIWLNELRARAVRKSQSLAVTPEAELVAGGPDAETNLFASQVFKQVMALPAAQRETVMLVYVEGYPYREAAEILGVPIGTIMSRLSAARAKLRPLADGPEARAMEAVAR